MRFTSSKAMVCSVNVHTCSSILYDKNLLENVFHAILVYEWLRSSLLHIILRLAPVGLLVLVAVEQIILSHMFGDFL